MDENATPEPAPPPPPPPSPFVVPPPGRDITPPSPRARVVRRVRNGVIVVAVLVISLGVMGHIGGGGTAVSDLREGMCIKLPPGSFKHAQREDCAKPHDVELLGWIDDAMTIPQIEGATTTPAGDECASRFEKYSGLQLDSETYRVGYFIEKNDKYGEADVLCYVRSENGAPLTHSLKPTA